MWQVVKSNSALMDPKVLKTTVKKVKFAKGTKRGKRSVSATIVSGEGTSGPPLPINNGTETIVPTRYIGMESTPPPVRDLARSVTLSEFNHAGWFHDRYIAGTDWVRAWVNRFGLDMAIMRHPSRVEIELKNIIVIMPEDQSPERWVVEIGCNSSEKIPYIIDIAGKPLEPLCICTRYNKRRCRISFERVYPQKRNWSMVALQTEYHTYVTTHPYCDTQIGMGQGMMDKIKRRQQMHVGGTWPVADNPVSMAARKML